MLRLSAIHLLVACQACVLLVIGAQFIAPPQSLGHFPGHQHFPPVDNAHSRSLNPLFFRAQAPQHALRLVYNRYPLAPSSALNNNGAVTEQRQLAGDDDASPVRADQQEGESRENAQALRFQSLSPQTVRIPQSKTERGTSSSRDLFPIMDKNRPLHHLHPTGTQVFKVAPKPCNLPENGHQRERERFHGQGNENPPHQDHNRQQHVPPSGFEETSSAGSGSLSRQHHHFRDAHHPTEELMHQDSRQQGGQQHNRPAKFDKPGSNGPDSVKESQKSPPSAASFRHEHLQVQVPVRGGHHGQQLAIRRPLQRHERPSSFSAHPNTGPVMHHPLRPRPHLQEGSTTKNSPSLLSSIIDLLLPSTPNMFNPPPLITQENPRHRRPMTTGNDQLPIFGQRINPEQHGFVSINGDGAQNFAEIHSQHESGQPQNRLFSTHTLSQTLNGINRIPENHRLPPDDNNQQRTELLSKDASGLLIPSPPAISHFNHTALGGNGIMMQGEHAPASSPHSINHVHFRNDQHEAGVRRLRNLHRQTRHNVGAVSAMDQSPTVALSDRESLNESTTTTTPPNISINPTTMTNPPKSDTSSSRSVPAHHTPRIPPEMLSRIIPYALAYLSPFMSGVSTLATPGSLTTSPPLLPTPQALQSDIESITENPWVPAPLNFPPLPTTAFNFAPPITPSSSSIIPVQSIDLATSMTPATAKNQPAVNQEPPINSVNHPITLLSTTSTPPPPPSTPTTITTPPTTTTPITSTTSATTTVPITNIITPDEITTSTLSPQHQFIAELLAPESGELLSLLKSAFPNELKDIPARPLTTPEAMGQQLSGATTTSTTPFGMLSADSPQSLNTDSVTPSTATHHPYLFVFQTMQAISPDRREKLATLFPALSDFAQQHVFNKASSDPSTFAMNGPPNGALLVHVLPTSGPHQDNSSQALVTNNDQASFTSDNSIQISTSVTFPSTTISPSTTPSTTTTTPPTTTSTTPPTTTTPSTTTTTTTTPSTTVATTMPSTTTTTTPTTTTTTTPTTTTTTTPTTTTTTPTMTTTTLTTTTTTPTTTTMPTTTTTTPTTTTTTPTTTTTTPTTTTTTPPSTTIIVAPSITTTAPTLSSTTTFNPFQLAITPFFSKATTTDPLAEFGIPLDTISKEFFSPAIAKTAAAPLQEDTGLEVIEQVLKDSLINVARLKANMHNMQRLRSHFETLGLPEPARSWAWRRILHMSVEGIIKTGDLADRIRLLAAELQLARRGEYLARRLDNLGSNQQAIRRDGRK